MVTLRWADETFELTPGEYVLGRSSQSDIQVVHDSVSRRHARLIIEEKAAYIEDMGSSNGTYLNGKLVSIRTPLANGDKIHLGKALLIVELPQPSEQATVIFDRETPAIESQQEGPSAKLFDERTEGLPEPSPKVQGPPPIPPTQVQIPPQTITPPRPPTPPVEHVQRPSPSPSATVPSPASPAQPVQQIPPLRLEIASFGPRFLGWLIDFVLINIPVLLILGMAILLQKISPALVVLISILGWVFILALSIANLVYGPAVKGKSLGQHLMKLRIITEDNRSPIGWGPALIRWLVQGFCSGFFFIGYLWHLWDAKGQTLHDKVAHTYVVRETR